MAPAAGGCGLFPALLGADWSTGELGRYTSRLQECFDGPEQILEIYSTRDAKGGEAFDYDLFFSDVGVEDRGHRELFYAWFADQLQQQQRRRHGGRGLHTPPCGAESTSQQRGSGSAIAGLVAPYPQQAGVGGAAAGFGVGGDSLQLLANRMSTIDWNFGELQQYAKAFDDNFDDPREYPNQVVDAYVRETASGRVFEDAQFFQDLGVEDAGHKDLFRAWFKHEHGASSQQWT